jgi:hypothetical protein
MRAILSRTELEPISTAAKTLMIPDSRLDEWPGEECLSAGDVESDIISEQKKFGQGERAAYSHSAVAPGS